MTSTSIRAYVALILTRAVINWSIDPASPQNKQPKPNMEYAKSKHGLRPKMSLSFPYRGWKDVKVRK